MKKLKISFLIPAHNEEKIIGKALEGLVNFPYDNFEVLVGLDRCSDHTLDIVKSYKNKINSLKYYELNSTDGKPQVIDNLMKHASGDIIIIHDADWIFNVKSKEYFIKFISVFDNKNIGGIAESFPVEYNLNNNKSNYWFKAVSLSHYYWMEYQKVFLTKSLQNYKILKDPTMFLTNIFRKELYRINYSLADDFERSKNIMDKGFKIILFDDLNMPRFISSYDKINLKDLFNQKRRTSIARKQLQINHSIKLSFLKYTLPVLFYMLKKSFRNNFSTGIKVILWIIINFIAKLSTIFSSLSTQKGWTLRASR